MARTSGKGRPSPGDTPNPGATAGGNTRSPHQELHMALAASEFWTASAMQEAEPYPLPEVGPKVDEKEDALALALSAEPGQIKGVPPEGSEPAETSPVATTGGYDYPGPYTRFEVPQVIYGVYPWITVGKVFFKQNGGSYVASAASIGNYAIWTAGHVVHAGDGKPSGWSTDMIFVPAYRDGSAPYGKWSVSYLWTRTTWYQNGNPNGLTEDMGGGILNTLESKKISQKVGALGFAWNRGRLQHWNSLGYPAASPFNGQRMHDCQASYAYDGSVPGIKPVAIGCDMTGGCSGGPWVLKLLTDNTLNGNNSYRQSNRPEEMNSPYFDDRAKSLFDALQASTP
jgi:V8-like Glu-specific endopeptidase